jgi:large subunit ribosomal protein L22
MEVTARLRYLQASPQKVRLVADQVRGRSVEEAAQILKFSGKHAAAPLAKLLRSAIANAENRDEHVDLDRLYVKEISVDGGPTLKRIRPQPMGRAFRILKRQSHITIKLGSRRDEA